MIIVSSWPRCSTGLVWWHLLLPSSWRCYSPAPPRGRPLFWGTSERARQRRRRRPGAPTAAGTRTTHRRQQQRLNRNADRERTCVYLRAALRACASYVHYYSCMHVHTTQQIIMRPRRSARTYMRPYACVTSMHPVMICP